MLTITLGAWHCTFRPWQPTDGRIFDFFSFHPGMIARSQNSADLVPTLVLGVACDGNRGIFLEPQHLLSFFAHHEGIPYICHGAALTLKVAQAAWGSQRDAYAAVERHLVWDTQILHRLFALATAGHAARDVSDLFHCAAAYLRVNLGGYGQQGQEHPMNAGFEQGQGKPPSFIPEPHLRWLGEAALAIWHLYGALQQHINQVLHSANRAFGFVSPGWLQDAIGRFGPLTHHIQLRASILTDVLTANGIGLDHDHRDARVSQLQAAMAACQDRLRKHRNGPSVDAAKLLQEHLALLERTKPGLADFSWAPDGLAILRPEELAAMASVDALIADYLLFQATEGLLEAYQEKGDCPRLHPQYDYLMATGRTYSCSPLNLECLCNEATTGSPAPKVRECLIPERGHVFIDCGYGQPDFVALGFALQYQFGLDSQMARLVNNGQDLLRLLAAKASGLPPEQVRPEDREAAIPVSLHVPTGVGIEGLKRIIFYRYANKPTEYELEGLVYAYFQLCPELTPFVVDEVDLGHSMAEMLQMTPAEYQQSINPSNPCPSLGADNQPAGWLGGMLFKVLGTRRPVTRQGAGRPYTKEEIAYLWAKAQQLAGIISPSLRSWLHSRRADPKLAAAFRHVAAKRAVITWTGRLRGKATFSNARACIFQGLAADGALMGLWQVWRAGYRLVAFTNDKLVVESPADDRVWDRAGHIGELMRQGMQMVVPGMRIQVQAAVTRSLERKDLDPRYCRSDT